MFVAFQSKIYFDWILRLVSVSLILQSVEVLKLKILWGDHGVFSWSILRKTTGLIGPLFDFLFKEKIFQILIVLNIFFSAWLLVFGLGLAIIYPLFFLCLWFIRLGGSFNGGSDAMTALVVGTCALKAIFSESDKIAKFCLWYLVFQILLSYFVAGVVKIRNAEWRNGTALKFILLRSSYVIPPFARKIVLWPAVPFLASWTIIIFECTFPAVLINSQFMVAYLALAFAFHVANFYLLGLNRFVWAWIAAYPALWCVVSLKL